MSSRYSGGVVRKNQLVPTTSSASGVWNLGEATQATKADIWPYSGVPNPISQSLRFRAGASPFLSRTASSAPTSNQRFTISFWFKPSLYKLASEVWLFSCGTNSGRFGLYYNVNDSWALEMQSAEVYVRPSRKWRDPSAWYHIVIAVDSTQATSSNRVKWYTNGVLEDNSELYPNQNITFDWNANGTLNYIGRFFDGRYYDGCLADFHNIDGQQLTPSSFGQTSAITGVWEPKQYSGTYGTNGYRLEFKDTTIGQDTSGNNNDWTPSGFSTTLGSTYDLMTDVPTQWSPRNTNDVGGVVRGNYATWNPLVLFPTTTYQSSITDGNLLMTKSGGGQGGAVTSIAATTGKFYAEMPVIGVGGSVTRLGVMATNNPSSISAASEYAIGDTSASVAYRSSGARLTGGTTTNSWGSTYTTGDVIGVAFDADTGKIWFAKNGTWQASGDPAAGTNQAATLPTGVPFYFSAGGESGISISLNCGQRPFAYTPPAGFKSLCTTNLPTPTIGATVATAANKNFDATLYTGTGSNLTVTNAGSFQPDFIWIKQRSGTQSHCLYDVVRGATKQLNTNNTVAEDTYAGVSSFNSNGFSIGTADNNTNGSTYVSWQWKAGGSAVTNTTGSISAQVSANPTTGFSIATFTGNGTGGATVGHGLGVAPAMIMFKGRNSGTSGLVWHTGYDTNQGQQLIDSTAAIYNPGNGLYFNSTYPSSTVVTLGTSGATNGNGTTYVLYSWAAIAGYSAFGKYTGNGSSNGPFVYTGFRPKFIIVKRTDASDNWMLMDTSINPINVASTHIRPDSSSAELNPGGSPAVSFDFLSNGFKNRESNNQVNNSGGTYIYMAFAEHPFKNSLAR